jgi:hypothetical protein
MWRAVRKMFDLVPADAFDRLIAAVFQRMGLSALTTKAKAYQIKFSDESVFFISEKLDGWFEISTMLGAISPKNNNEALALLSLQLQQGAGPLVGVGLNPAQRCVVFARLRVGFCYPEDVIAALQLVRARSIEIKVLLQQSHVAGQMGC